MELKEYVNVLFRDFTSFAGLSFSLLILTLFFFVDFVLAKKLLSALIIAYSIVILIRSFYFKHRPKKEGYKNFFEKLDASSFPSLHSCRAAILFFLFSSFFKNIGVTSILFIVMLASVYSRIYLKKHDWVDVLAGFALGIAISLWIFPATIF